ncbi:hypothetical protein E2C01_079856 [Portunus trituberculatus]|uniref:Uncharacterized protein n=1 Tax=Portunus trituberculatus TaxID=210409 RepID=A0A5B7IWR4_PORTR|nr:hypothetical protein [Portunus trituberculatus]
MDTLTGGLSDGLYDLVPSAHHAAHADTTHAHTHARDGDGTASLTAAAHAHQQHNPASSAARLTVLSTSRPHDQTPRGN